MKKLLLSIIIMSTFIFSKTLTINENICIYSEASRKSKIAGYAKAGDVFEILDTVTRYYEIDVIKGDTKKNTSDHAGKDGFMWSDRVDAATGMVIIEGCTLRSSPKLLNNGTPDDTADDPNFVAKVKKGAKIRIKKNFDYWYKIEIGWAYYTRITVNN